MKCPDCNIGYIYCKNCSQYDQFKKNGCSSYCPECQTCNGTGEIEEKSTTEREYCDGTGKVSISVKNYFKWTCPVCLGTGMNDDKIELKEKTRFDLIDYKEIETPEETNIINIERFKMLGKNKKNRFNFLEN